MEGKVYIVTHKSVYIPMIEKMEEYQIIQTGNNRVPSLGYLSASSGKNIADENEYYAELTVYYWLWKNVTYDYVGINAYRRFLYYKNHLITKKEIEGLLAQYDALVPRKINTGMTVEEQWARWHKIKDLLSACDYIREREPEYNASIEHILKSGDFHICNMIITKKSYLMRIVNGYFLFCNM